MEIKELKYSYYEYIANISPGIAKIINHFRTNNNAYAFASLAQLAEGLSALLKIEEALSAEGFFINSQIANSLEVYAEIIQAIEAQDFILVADIIEYELAPLFSSATEWIFERKEG